MLYTLELGPYEKKIIADSVRSRRPLPDRIRDAPELRPGLGLFYEGFLDLTTCRSVAAGVEGPITWSDIKNYCDEYGLTGEIREDFFYFVQRLDSAYLERQLKNREAAAAAKLPPSSGMRTRTRR